MLKKIHLKNRLLFAKKFIDQPDTVWRNVLWTDETKVVQYNHDKDKQYFRRPSNQQFNEKYTIKTVKYGGLRLMLWGCFEWNGVGPLVQIVGKMDATYYVHIILKAVPLKRKCLCDRFSARQRPEAYIKESKALVPGQ